MHGQTLNRTPQNPTSLAAVWGVMLIGLCGLLPGCQGGAAAGADMPQKTFADLQKEKMVAKKLFETPVPVSRDSAFNTPLGHMHGKTYYVWCGAEDRQIRITQIDGEQVTTRPLVPAGDYRVLKDGHNTFSLGVDKSGYIHVVGDMHNGSAYRKDIPERYQGNFIMYWRSTKPHDISSFEFLGKDPERYIPAREASYYAFHHDRNDEMYFTCRTRILEHHEGGEVALGMYRYDVAARKWRALGDLPPGLADRALGKVVVWEDNGQGHPGRPGWYQWSQCEIRFDLQNRLHLAMVWTNDSEHGNNGGTDVIYARSDDGGETWRKADGTKIERLPLRVDPGPHQADIVVNDDKAGYDGIQSKAIVAVDRHGTPAVVFEPINHTPTGQTIWMKNYLTVWQEDEGRWSEPHELSGCYIKTRARSFLANNGVLTWLLSGPEDNGLRRMTEGDLHDRYVHHDTGADSPLDPHQGESDLFNVDKTSVYKEDVIRALAATPDGKRIMVYEIRFVQQD